MTLSATDPKGLTVVLLIVYIILFQPAIYILFKHGRSGILGWISIQVFCLIRVVGSAITLHEEAIHSTSKWSILVNSIGLSPLLLGSMGILHEAHSARLHLRPTRAKRVEYILIILYHSLVSLALGLLIIGTISLINNNLTSGKKTLAKCGLSILLLCFAILVGVTVANHSTTKKEKNAGAYREGTTLLWGVTAALPFVGIRVFYAAAVLSHMLSGTSNGFTRSEGAKVLLGEIPELLVIVVLVGVGFVTRDIVRERMEGGEGGEGRSLGSEPRYEELSRLRGTGGV
ncbi:hypothetical protein NHQ30_011095 [Ciborinia camelliae]|nr:hypothetical protein NHQ30_011095 [Ciborinia camelliae]